MNITIKQGVDNVLFGMIVEDVVSVIGKPDSVENMENAIDESTTVLRYDGQGLTLFFDGDELRLSCIDVCNEDVLLFGKKIFDLPERKIVETMINNNYFEQDADNEDWGERRISFPEGNIDFFFENDSLVSVVIGK